MILHKYYQIHRETYLIRTVHEAEQSYALVYEKGQQLYVQNKPLKIIDAACQAIGTSFQTSAERSRQILGNKLKVPIIVGYEEQNPFIMFPVYSPKSNHNIWITYNAIINVTNHKKKITITFKDGTDIDLPILMSSFNNQYVSSAMLYRYIEENLRQFNLIK